jgi:hypothetical protein
MKDRPFHITVTIEPKLGRFRYVRSASEAHRVLLQEWNGPRGPKYFAALVAVKDSLAEKKPPSHARRAFIAAAIEARILADHVVTPFTDARLTFAFRSAAE